MVHICSALWCIFGLHLTDILGTIKKYRITYTDKQILQLIESKEGDELDIEFEGIAEPKMDVATYGDLKNILCDYLVGKN